MSRLPSLPAVLLATIWYCHVAHTELNDPLGLPFDCALWAISGVLKLATLICILILLDRFMTRLAGNKHLVLRTGLIWSFGVVLFAVAASLTRE